MPTRNLVLELESIATTLNEDEEAELQDSGATVHAKLFDMEQWEQSRAENIACLGENFIPEGFQLRHCYSQATQCLLSEWFVLSFEKRT